MKANHYKSGNIATLIGASHEALRFYHNNEIFIPRKKEKANIIFIPTMTLRLFIIYVHIKHLDFLLKKAEKA